MDLFIEEKIINTSKRDIVNAAPEQFNEASKIPAELKKLLDHHIHLHPEITQTGEHYLHILNELSSVKSVPEEMYWFVWKLLMYLEHYENIQLAKQYSQFNQKLCLSRYRPSEIIISVPGLSENRPSVRNKDKINIFQVGGPIGGQGEVKFVGNDYVSVKMPESFPLDLSSLFNIEFTFSDWQIKAQNKILDEMQKHNLSAILYPRGELHPEAPQIEEINWINKSIATNPGQQQAVRNILRKTALPAPYILFGPPGTGKTSTLVETICQILNNQPNSRILICTPSNSAADEISIRLLKNSIAERSLYRMYSTSRNSKDIDANIKPFSNCMDSAFVYVSYEVFLTKKIVITTLATCFRLHSYNLRDNHFEYLFVDEAGQATELETLIPFLLISAKSPTLNGQIVMAGDPMQLGPLVQSPLARPLLGKSMLERFINWGLYEKNSSGQYNQNYITKLTLNYRSHEAILHLPNDLFYDGDLQAIGGRETRKAENWEKLPNKKFPIIFHSVISAEERSPHSPSFFNHQEMSVVVHYVQTLLNARFNGKNLATSDIGVITPYRLQKAKLSKALTQVGVNDVTVGTVEALQGQERDVIIVSTVRSKIYRAYGGNLHIGHLSNPKRFNVAITRAKSLLIVIGNPQVLQHDTYWRSFMQYCIENKACTGHHFILDTSITPNIVMKNSKPWKPVINRQIQEDPTSGIDNDDREEEIDRNRRQRRPMGPLTEQLALPKQRDLGFFDVVIQSPRSLEKPFFDNQLQYTDDDDSDTEDEGFTTCSSSGSDSYDSGKFSLKSHLAKNTDEQLWGFMEALNLHE